MITKISSSATYLRLISRRSNTKEVYVFFTSKQYVSTVPVKRIRTQNARRHSHLDSHFAAATIKYSNDLAMLFGSESVFIISQNGRARVQLYLPAAKKQVLSLTYLEYRTELSDNDFVTSEKHKLIPFIHGALVFKDEELLFSGPTYITVRSGKHDHSRAFTHLTGLLNC
ncbi:unnamed protein product [Adineta steineri]|uniref:Uncharacterized protein n=1 Tax=Adineta steineri TaxID=433720 RepID=A0A815ZZ22_9BILA|nr:unnamed protein product [Adineta steineri]CAF1589479.1 unnamed protein product [Adineta steineri]